MRDLESGAERRTPTRLPHLNRAAIHPGLRHVAAAGRGLEVWRFPDLVREFWREGGYYSVAFSAGGRMALGHFNGLSVGDGLTPETLRLFGTRSSYLTRLAFSPDGSLLAGRDEGRLWVWEVSPGGVDLVDRPGLDRWASPAFHPNGRLLAAACVDGKVRIWGVDDWRERAVYAWGVGHFQRLAFAPDGLRAAVGGDASKIVVWDVDV